MDWAQDHACQGATRFERLMVAYETRLARYLYGMVGDVETARDLTQETLLSAYRSLPSTEVNNLNAWLYRIATNHALAHLRRQRLVRWVSFARLLGTDDEPGEPSSDDQLNLSVSIETVLARLEPKDRATLLLSAAGFSSQEMAGLLGCSPGAARVRLSRARDTFRQLYHPDSPMEDR